MAQAQLRGLGLALLAPLLAVVFFLMVASKPAHSQANNWDFSNWQTNLSNTVFAISLFDFPYQSTSESRAARRGLIIGSYRRSHLRCPRMAYPRRFGRFIFHEDLIEQTSQEGNTYPATTHSITIRHRSLTDGTYNNNLGYVYMFPNTRPNVPNNQKITVGIYTVRITFRSHKLASDSYTDYTNCPIQPNAFEGNDPFATIAVVDSPVTNFLLLNTSQANTSFSPVLITSNLSGRPSRDVGITIQHAFRTCELISVTVKGPLTLNAQYVNRTGNTNTTVAFDSTSATQPISQDSALTSFVNFALSENRVVSGIYTMTVEALPWGAASTVSNCNWGGSTVLAQQSSGVSVTFNITITEPTTWANQGQNNTVASGTFRREDIAADSNSTGIDTGIRFHMGQPDACLNIRATIGGPNEFEIRRYNAAGTADSGNSAKGTTLDAHMQKGNGNDRHFRLYMNKGDLRWGIKRVTLRAWAINCFTRSHTFYSKIASPLTLGGPIVYEITVHDTWKGVGASVSPAPPRSQNTFSPVRLSLASSPVDTGITIARNIQACWETDITLLTHTDVVEMEATNNTTLTVASSGYTNVPMGTYSNNNHQNNRTRVHLQFKASVALGAGQKLSLTVRVAANTSNCNPNGGVPPPEHYSYVLTAGSPVNWQILNRDSTNVAQVFSAPLLRIGSQAVDTGVQLHRSSTACRSTDVQLLSHSNFLGLAQFKRNGTAPEGNPGTRFTLTMHESASANDDSYVRLRFPRAAANAPAGTISVTIKASYSDATSGNHVCNSADVPHPITLQYVITLNPYYPWTVLAKDDENDHVLQAGGPYTASAIRAAQDPVDTGIIIHRNSGHPTQSANRCEVNDLRMVTNEDLFVLNLTRISDDRRVLPQLGATVINAQMPGAEGNTNSQSSGEYVKLQFRPGADVPAGIITAAVEVKANRGCGADYSADSTSEIPPPLTLSYRMRVMANTGDASWRSLADEVTNPTSGTFNASALARNNPTAAGVRIHRTSTSCTSVAVRLSGGGGHLDLRTHGSNAAASPNDDAATAHTVTMEDNTSQRIGLYFKPNRSLVKMTINGALEVSAACSSGGPSAETVNFALTINDDVDEAPLIRFSGSTVNLSQATSAIIVPITDASGINLEVSEYNDAETGFPAIVLKQASSNLFELVEDPNNKSYQLVELNLRPKADVTLALPSSHLLTIEATDASDSSKKSTATLMLTVVRSPAAEAAAANSSVGGAAIRAIGIGSFDAVLSRAAVGGGDARLAERDGAASHEFLRMLQAKESELEEGDIDLREFLRGQAFSLPLMNANGGFGSGLGIWGQVDMLDIEGGEGTEFSHEGELFSAQFGVDTLLGGGFLAGVSYGIHEVESNYLHQVLNRTDGGKYALEIDVVQPYAAMDALGGRIAVAAGFGNGQMTLEGSGDGAASINNSMKRDVGYRSYSLGYGMSLGDPGDDDSISMRGAFSSSELDLDEDEGSTTSLDAETSSLRLALEYARSIDFGSGQAVRPAIEVAYARSWGKSDEDDGNGYELVAGLGYVAARLEADAKFVYLSTSGENADSKASGGSFSFRYSPTAGGLGLSLQARPSYGPTSGTGTLWEASAERDLSQFANSERRLSLNAGYGLAIPGGVLTPYGSYGVSGSSAATRELGLRLRTGGLHDRWLLRLRDSGGESAEELKIEYWLE